MKDFSEASFDFLQPLLKKRPDGASPEGEAGEAEPVLEAFIESLPGIFYFFDEHLRYRRWNRQLEQIFGWSGEELAKKSPLELVAEEDREATAERIAEVFRHGEAHTVARLETRAGRKIPYYLTGRRLLVGDELCIVGVGIDISGAEKLQHERDSFFRLSADLFFMGDPAGHLFQLNPAWTKLLGWGVEELENRPLLSIIHPDDVALALVHLEKLRAGVERLEWEARCLHKEGGWRLISWSVILLPGVERFCALGRDVTAAREAETRTRESEQRYRALFDINPLPMLLVEVHTQQILEVNEAAVRHYGFSRREFLQAKLPSIWSEDAALSRGDGDCEAFAKELSGCWRHRKRDGDHFDAAVSARAITLGALQAAILLVDDVTVRARAAEFDAALAKLGQKLVGAATPVDAGRIIAEISRDLIGWDAFFITLYSHETETLLPVLTVDTIDGVLCECNGDHPPGAQPSPVFRQVIGGEPLLILREEGTPVQTNFVYGDVTRRSESLLFVPIREEEQVVGVLSIQSYRPRAFSQHDLKTLEALAGHCGGALQRLQIQSALRRAEQRFAQAFAASPIGMCLCGYKDGRIIGANPAFLGLFGLAHEAIVGRSGLELGIWADVRDQAKVFDDVRNGRSVRDRQIAFRTQSGQLRHVLVSVEILEVEGERSLLFYNYDVTERVNLEAQLRQSQKLESVGQLAAGVAHDFNNLLTVISGCTSLALTNEELGEHPRGLLQQVAEASDRAASLTRQLLAFSCRQKMNLQQVDLNHLVSGLAVMLRRLLGANIELQVSCSDNLPPIAGDPGMLEQVLVNLAVNARDAMERGGRLKIATGKSKIGPQDSAKPPSSPAGTYGSLTVSDTGSGISAEHLPRLFEPFFTTKESGKGSGLGLATAYGIVKQHGGWITVKTTPGQGTVFTIILPLSSAPLEAASQPAALEPVQLQGTERVLVVEDEPALRALIREVLEYYGYKTVVASNAHAALAVWEKQRDEIDAVVTDIAMPGGMDGRELGERLLQERQELPIVFTSGYGEQLAGVTPLLGQGRMFLPKPFQSASLAKALRSVLDARAPAGAADGALESSH